MEEIYVVTLYNFDDLEQFYLDMEEKGIRLNLKRPLSRNTLYWMTPEQVEELRNDDRVWDIEKADNIVAATYSYNPTSYTKSGTFTKSSSTTTPSTDNYLQWGHLHSAGTSTQRRKNGWGNDKGVFTVTDNVSIFNNGKHVDVVICDDPVSYDCAEWNSPSTGLTRFVQYQWFNNLNAYVSSIDDDGQGKPSGTITYYSNTSNPNYHGNHVTGTVAGQYYGWAREANIYNLAVTAAWSSGQSVGGLLIFDYLRAFHRYKGINPVTGKKNPTVTNHSYGGIIPGSTNLTFANLSSLVYRGVTYKNTNPGPSGWTQTGITTDFGVRFGSAEYYPGYSSSVVADVQDAIKEGIIIVGAAGNANLYMANGPTDPDWNNYITVTGVGSINYMRGSWPNSADSGTVTVGALDRSSNFSRATFTNFGPGIDVFAPGVAIVSSYNNTGTADTKYGGSNYYAAISGTSMASPQVCGIAACLASGKQRFTQEDLFNYLKNNSQTNDMTFDVYGGGFADNTSSSGSINSYVVCKNPRATQGLIDPLKGQRKTSGQVFPRRNTLHEQPFGFTAQIYTFNISASGSLDYTISGADRNGLVNAPDPPITIYVGDKINFILGAGITSHPFWLKTNQIIGVTGGITSGTVTNNGGILAGDIVSWDTTGVSPGTYYYISQYDLDMTNTITVLAVP